MELTAHAPQMEFKLDEFARAGPVTVGIHKLILLAIQPFNKSIYPISLSFSFSDQDRAAG